MNYDDFKQMVARQSKKQKRRHLESKIQQRCVLWFRLMFPQYIIFAIPNGGSRNSIEAANLKREGALSGVSDLIVIARKSVLFVEMKTEKGKQQETQKKFQSNVENLGHQYVICRSLDNFQLTIKQWLKNIQKDETTV